MKIRKARAADVKAIQKMINDYADKGLMLHKSLNSIYENIRDFLVAEKDGEVVAAGANYVYWDELGEIGSVAVAPSYQGKGLGLALTGALIDYAGEIGIKRLFLLTFQPDFFKKLGFKVIDKDDLPHKIWKVCLNCPKYPDSCDETAMELLL
ncbi:MAG: N-acetyltransferase [Fibrobacterota bacterium]